MYTHIKEYSENICQNKYPKICCTQKRIAKKFKNYESNRPKSGTFDAQKTNEEYYNEFLNDTSRKKENITCYIKHKRSTLEDNLSQIKQNLDYKKGINNNVKQDHKANNNDIMRINTITYFSEVKDKNNVRSISTSKKNNNIENTYIIEKRNAKLEDKKRQIENKIELDYSIKKDEKINIKNASSKIINKTRSNYPNLSNDINKYKDINRENIAKYGRRSNKNSINIKDSSYLKTTINNNDNKLKENENKFIKHSSIISTNKNKYIRICNFEITYESDQGEKKNFTSNKKNRSIINNFSKNKKYKYNCLYNKNNYIEESSKYNNNNYEEINETYSSVNDTKSYPNNYQCQITHNESINNTGKKKITIIDSFDAPDIYNNFNNKSITFGNISKKKNKNNSRTLNNFQKLQSAKTSSSKKVEGQNDDINFNRDDNNSTDIKIPNCNNHNILRKKYNINSHISIDNSVPINSKTIIVKKDSNNSVSNINNSSRIKKKKLNLISKSIKGKTYYRKSDIKKIILIQSAYRTHLSLIKFSQNFNYNTNLKELYGSFNRLFNVIKKSYLKFFMYKLIRKSSYKLLSQNKVKKYSFKNKKKENTIFTTNNRLFFKNREINKFHKEMGDSFYIINDKNNGLKLKLDNMIKENNQLKSQIFDNKNIEEKLKQLLLENKKNQNINAIIMKDNQQLAKKLKSIEEKRNNKLDIQNQHFFDLFKKDNLQKLSFNSSKKLKNLYLKCLVLKNILKYRNILKLHFNKFRENTKKEKSYKIENNNIFINDRKKINIQMAKNFNINFVSQNDNYKHFLLYKLFMKKEKNINKILSKFFYKFFYTSKFFFNINTNEKTSIIKNEINEIEEKNEIKKSKLQSIINKYERNLNILYKNTYNEWKLRSIIFKMKAIAKEIKRRKKLKKKIREKIARATIKNLKNKTSKLQNTHEFSYNIDKTIEKHDDLDKSKNDNKIKSNEIEKKDNNNNNNISKSKERKNENNNENIESDDSESSFGLDD